MRIFRLILFLALSSCVGNLVEEETIEEMPEFSRDDISGEQKKNSEINNYIVQFDSIEPLNMERIKTSSLVRNKPNGSIIFKIHASHEVHCSRENFGNWKYIEMEFKDGYEIRTINKGSIFQELWQDDEIIATRYRRKEKDGTYGVPGHLKDGDNDFFIRGFTYSSNILSETIPERELEKIILKGDLSKSALDLFIWNFQFQFGGDSLNAHENILMFYMTPSHIDGESAPDRLLLIFESNMLVAVKHDRPLKINPKAIYKCEFGLTLSIIADWEKEKMESFANEFLDCR